MIQSGTNSSKILIMALSILLLTWGFAGSDFVLADPGGNGNGNGNGGNGNGNGNGGNGNGNGNGGNGNGNGNGGNGNGNGNGGNGNGGSSNENPNGKGNGKLKFESLKNIEEQEEHQKMIKTKSQGIMVKKTDKRIRDLLLSDNPEESAKKLGLDFDKGKTKLVLKLKNLDKESLNKLKTLGEIEVQSDNIIQVSTDVNNIVKINSLSNVEQTRTPYSLSDYTNVDLEDEKSLYLEVEYDTQTIKEIEEFVTAEENEINDSYISEETSLIENSIENIESDVRATYDSFDNQLNNDDGQLAYDLVKTYREYEATFDMLREVIMEEKMKAENSNTVDSDQRIKKLVQLEFKLNKLSQMRNLIVDSELDENSKAESLFYGNVDIVHAEGITGKNVKVAVLDLSFDKTNIKIANNIVDSKSFKSGQEGQIVLQNADNFNSYAHGTAVAEIITDVAPNTELFLYEMDTDVEFAAAVDEAIANDVDVIAMAAGWPNLPTDGTSHITQKVEEAVSHGITFIVPSGNFAQKHWEGVYADSDYNSWHEFSGTDEGLSLEITDYQILHNQPIMVYLNWQESMGEQTDFDLVLVDPLGQIVEYSANQQSGPNDEDTEYVFHMPQMPGLYAIGISYSGDVDPTSIPRHTTLEIFSVNNEVEYTVAKSSVVVPGDANGAIVVGAISNNDGTLESFSSHGPTNDGRMAPHVVGPDGITTLAYEGKLFYGTSATTPYVAGIAALILEDKNLTPKDVLSMIQENALLDNHIKDSELVNGFGYGTLDAMFLIEQ